MTDRGWRLDGSTPISELEAEVAAQGVTVGALEDMAGGYRSVDPALVTRLARACLFGVAPTR